MSDTGEVQDVLFQWEQESPKDEGVILFNTGRVKLWWLDDSGEEEVMLSWELRLPRLGEYRKIREIFLDLNATEDGDKQRELVVDWTQHVVATLSKGKKRLPEDSDIWPIWLTTGFLQGALINHWQNVPLVLGGSVPTTTPPK